MSFGEALPRIALDNDASLVVVNLEPTPMDGAAEVAIHSRAGEVLSRIVERVR